MVRKDGMYRAVSLGVFIAELLLAFAPTLRSQSPMPDAAWKVQAQNALKDRRGIRFNWTASPDNSLVVSFGRPDGQWTVQRITGWETPTPHVETVTFTDKYPQRYLANFGEPVLDPTGKYLVIRPGFREVRDAAGREVREASVAVIDLRTFSLVFTAQARGNLESGDLFFARNGTLILSNWHINAEFLHESTVLSLPNLEPIASCKYNLPRTKTDSSLVLAQLAELSADCAVVMKRSGATTELQLETGKEASSDNDARATKLGCEPVVQNAAGSLELRRCGKDYFTDDDGLFCLTLWSALKVFTIPEGKEIFSLPIRFSDSKSSGIFSRADGNDYLLVRRGLKVEAYRMP